MNRSRSSTRMPEALAAQLRAARESRSMQGERRVVTILFCDVSGSTAMAGQLDPEEWAEIMNDAFDYLISPIYRYEGTVARLMGDGLVAFFGAPIAHEDDPQRAVLAGLDIVKGIQTFRQQIHAEYGLDFNVRVGIDTGSVVVGEIGSDQAFEYTAMGDAINMASRMEATAVPGTVQVTENTYKLIAALFEVWELDPLQIKGVDVPVPAYRILGWSTEPGALHGIEGLDAPLIGRESEMETLRCALADLRSARGGIVYLVGEAGLGKSRLIEELRSAAQTTAHGSGTGTPTWLESRSLSYDGSHPYGLFVQFIHQNMDIRESDPPAVVRSKVSRGAAALAPDQRERMARMVGAVLGLDMYADDVEWGERDPTTDSSADLARSGIFRLSIGDHGATWDGVEIADAVGTPPNQADKRSAPIAEGEGFKRELFATLLSATQAVATRQPTVLVCDDIHWTDPASIELLAHLFQLVERLPILFVCAMRPYRRSPAWEAAEAAQERYAAHFTKIELHPLTQQQGEKLVSNLLAAVNELAVDDLPVVVRRSIWQKTEGNPFFVEEVVRALIDSGAVLRVSSTDSGQPGGRALWDPAIDVEEIAIPDHVQSLLIARIDRLDKETRNLLQLAAVIGRAFDHRLLRELRGTVVELDKQLDTLQRAQLVREVARDPDPRYAFRHALTRDAAYSSILHRRRRELHRKVGTAMESLLEDRDDRMGQAGDSAQTSRAGRVDEEAHRLAYHFFEGRDLERALEYYTIAADRAARIYANTEAVEQYRRAIDIALRREGESGRLAQLYVRRGRTLEICGQYDDALDNYRELETLARERDDLSMELAALLPQATLHSTYTAVFNPRRGRMLSEQALALGRKLKDFRSEAKALWNLMLVALLAEDDRQTALTYGEQALELARTHNLREEIAYTLHDLASVYAGVGRPRDAWAAGEEAGGLWRELGNQPMLVDNRANAAWGRYQLGHLDEAVAIAGEALQISRTIGSLWGETYSLFTLAPFYLEQCDYGRAMGAIQEGVPLAQQANFEIAHVLAAALGGVYGFLGDLGRSVQMLHKVVATSERREDRMLALTILAYVALHHQRPAFAGAAIKAASEQFPADATHPFLSISRVMAPVVLTEIALANGAYDRVLTLSAKGIHAAFQPDAPASNQHTVSADLLRLRGHALMSLGRTDKAYTALNHARTEAASRDSDRMSWMFLYILWQRRTMWKTLMALSEIEARRGNQAEAKALRAQARDYVIAVAEKIAQADLRSAFLGLPDMRDVVSET